VFVPESLRTRYQQLLGWLKVANVSKR